MEMQRYNIGDIVEIAEDEKENYQEFEWVDKKLKITHVATNDKEHRGYDMTVSPIALYDFVTINGQDVNCSLYDYELK